MKEANKTIYSLGPLIHNPQVVDKFEKGLKVVASLDGLEGEKGYYKGSWYSKKYWRREKV